jgi:aminopeptidase N
LGTAAAEVNISREKIKGNIKWLNSNLNKIDKWLTDNLSIAPEKINYRLSADLVPLRYEINLRVQFDNEFEESFPYDGEITMFFMSNKDTSDLIFHINKILIDNSTLSIKSLTDNSFNQINNFKWKNDYERQFFVANLAQTFKANNNYTVSMKFTGYLASDNAGFYRSSYLDADKNKIWLLASQMQPTDARKAFPCFDEPGMKATYKISVEHRSDYNAISNMPVEKITHL